MKRLNLKNIVAVLTVAIASIGFVLASMEKKVEEPVSPQPAELHWYFNEGNNTYTYLGQGATPPGDESCNPPTSEEEEICMKGLSTNPPASSVNDNTTAVQEIPREPLAN